MGLKLGRPTTPTSKTTPCRPLPTQPLSTKGVKLGSWRVGVNIVWTYNWCMGMENRYLRVALVWGVEFSHFVSLTSVIMKIPEFLHTSIYRLSVYLSIYLSIYHLSIFLPTYLPTISIFALASCGSVTVLGVEVRWWQNLCQKRPHGRL